MRYTKSLSIDNAVGINDRANPTVGIEGDVFIQDQTSSVTEAHFAIRDSILSLASSPVVNSYDIELSDATDVTAGDYISMQYKELGYQGIALSKTDNTLQMDTPIDNTFPINKTLIVNGVGNFNVDGSSTPITALFKPAPGAVWDIYSISISLIDNATMDDALFGGITALTNGIVLKRSGDYDNRLLFNIKTNGDFRLRGNLEYSDKAPSGYYGLIFKKHFKDSNGVAIRLNGDDNDQLELLIQDNLTTIYKLEVMAAGHIVVK